MSRLDRSVWRVAGTVAFYLFAAAVLIATALVTWWVVIEVVWV